MRETDQLGQFESASWHWLVEAAILPDESQLYYEINDEGRQLILTFPANGSMVGLSTRLLGEEKGDCMEIVVMVKNLIIVARVDKNNRLIGCSLVGSDNNRGDDCKMEMEINESYHSDSLDKQEVNLEESLKTGKVYWLKSEGEIGGVWFRLRNHDLIMQAIDTEFHPVFTMKLDKETKIKLGQLRELAKVDPDTVDNPTLVASSLYMLMFRLIAEEVEIEEGELEIESNRLN